VGEIGFMMENVDNFVDNKFENAKKKKKEMLRTRPNNKIIKL
jgi:hypothetical protein